MEPYVKANYKLKTLDGQDLQDILSFYDKRNYELKLKAFFYLLISSLILNKSLYIIKFLNQHFKIFHIY